MKKITAIIFLSLCTFLYSAAQHAIHIYHDKEELPDVLLNVHIDSITIENGNQVFATEQGKVEYALTSIDSIKFQGKFFKAIYPQLRLPGIKQRLTISTLTDRQDSIIPTFDISEATDFIRPFSSWNYERNALISFYQFTLEKNPSNAARRFTINAIKGDETVPIEIIQYGSNPLFILDEKPFNLGDLIVFPSDANDIEVKAPKTIIDSISFSNIYQGIVYDCDWMKATAKNDSTFIISIDENLDNSIRSARISYHSKKESVYFDSFPFNDSKNKIIQLRSGSHTPEEHRKALRELYDATDGDNWTYKENWWSDEPYYKWECINHDMWGHNRYWGDRVVSMQFSGRQFNGMRGMIPESFTVFMDDMIELPDLRSGALSGRFPDAVCNHPLWPELGWSMIQQNIWYGSNIDFTGINLKLPEVEVTDYLTNTRKTTSEILQENELTFIIHRSYPSSNNFDEVSFINKYLDYAPKGFGMVIAKDQEDGQNSEEEVQSYSTIIREMQAKGIPEGIVWTNHFGKANGGSVGSMSLIDKDGNLIWYTSMVWGLEGYGNVMDSYCRKILGEPVTHDPFVYDTYTSTDYSQDGEIITIQKATEGNGVNLVFMGDGYVDKDINGMYIEDMNAGINELFAIEPLKSLKPRFNIYIVKVVSPNECVSNGEQRLNHDANNVYEYIGKIPGVTPETAHVCVIANRPNDFAVNGYTDMNDNGGSIAWINEGKASSIIVHEAGGHGIGKLLDEYTTGHDDSGLSDEEKESLRQQLKVMYHDRGWGLNLSLYSEPEKSPWAHMFADDDYKNEVGMYQGAWMFPTLCWRSSENSVMNNDYTWFNAPSREAIYRQVMSASEGDSWEFGFTDFKQFDKVRVNRPDVRTQSLEAMPKENNIYVKKSTPRRLMKRSDGKYVSVAFDDKPDETVKQKNVPETLSNGFMRIECKLPNITLGNGQYIFIDGERIDGK